MFFLAVIRKLGVNYGQSLEMGPWWIIGIVGRFTIIFAPKFVTFFSLLHQNAVDIQKWPLRGYSYPSSTIWFSRISGDIENWWRHLWYKEHDHSWRTTMGDRSVETLGSKIRSWSVLVTFFLLPPKQCYFNFFFNCTDISAFTTLSWGPGFSEN